MIKDVIPNNCKIEVSPERYSCLNNFVEIAAAFARNMFRPVFIVDLFAVKFQYVSNLFPYFFGDYHSGNSDSISDDYQQLFVCEEKAHLKQIFSKAYDLFLTFTIEERRELVFSFYTYLYYNGEKKLVHLRISPLALTDDGDLWLVLCTASLSSRKTPGHYVMKLHNESEFLLYNTEKDRWFHKEGLVLSSEEKEILLLSSQGYTMKEIASILGRTEDTIKLYKRVIFSKLSVKSITEAVFAAINYNLL